MNTQTQSGSVMTPIQLAMTRDTSFQTLPPVYIDCTSEADSNQHNALYCCTAPESVWLGTNDSFENVPWHRFDKTDNVSIK